jgi:hypothetical protein
MKWFHLLRTSLLVKKNKAFGPTSKALFDTIRAKYYSENFNNLIKSLIFLVI